MIRILILDHGQGFGGTVVVAALLMRELDPKRFMVTLVTAADPDFASAQVAGFGEVVPLRSGFSYVQAMRVRRILLGDQPTVLRRVLNRVVFGVCSLLNLGYLIRLLLLVSERKFSLIHCNNYNNIEGMFAAWLFRIPCVLHTHGLIGRAGPVERWLERRLSPPVVAISEAVGQSVYRTGVPKDRVQVLYNPVARPAAITHRDGERRDSVRERLELPASSLLIGIVGRVIAWKGQREFVLACLQAFERVPALHAVIVGSGADFDDSYLEDVRALAHASSLAERFHFTGFVRDTASVYNDLDVLVHASIEPEPFGLVVTEAMAHGVPVIAANSGAPPEFIREGETGFLRDPRDTEELAECMVRLALDPELRERIGQAGKRYALEAFDSAAYARAFERLYDLAISAGPGAGRATA